MTDWSMGVFTIMSIMTAVIALIAGARFSYIDARYKNAIKNQNDIISKCENAIYKDEPVAPVITPEIFEDLIIARESVERYKSHQKINHDGIFIDMFSMAMIILFGMLATLGIFDDTLMYLILSLGVWLILPSAHFIRQISMYKKNI